MVEKHVKVKRNASPWRLALLTLLLLSSVCIVYGQGYEQWSKYIGGEDTEKFLAMQETSDGGLITAGTLEHWTRDDTDFYIVKTDSEGDVEWSKNYGDTKDDGAYAVAQTGDGGYVVAGDTKSYGAGLTDLWLIKIDSQGEMVWDKVYGGAKGEAAYSILVLGDGGYLMTGSTASYGAGSNDLWVLKTDADGTVLWNNTYGGTKSDMGNEIIPTSDGGYMIVGETSSYGAGWNDVWLLKMSSDGSIMWNHTYGGSKDDKGIGITEASDGGYVIVGSTESFGDGFVEVYVVKVDSEGTLEWEKNYGGADNDIARSVVGSPDGGYLVVGDTLSYGAGEYDVWLLAVSGDGEMTGDATFGGELREQAFKIVATSDDGFVIAGRTWSFGTSGDAYMVKITMEEPDLPDPAEFVLSNLVVSHTTVETEETVTVSVTVANVGEESGSYTAELLVDGSKVGEETATLEGGASETVEFTGVSGDEGTHTVSIGDLSGSFTVTAPPDEPGGIPGFPAASLVLGLSVTALALLRKRTQ